MGESIVRWTQQAKDCFDLNCQCQDCIIYRTIETQCLMKRLIPKIYKRFGLPPEKIED